MLQVDESKTLEEASNGLLDFILRPENWVALSQLRKEPGKRPGENADYQRQVGKLRICASVDVTPTLEVFLRVAFHAPGLTPLKAADHLEAFLTERFPMVPNTEWQVQVDARRWVHFSRPYVGDSLNA